MGDLRVEGSMPWPWRGWPVTGLHIRFLPGPYFRFIFGIPVHGSRESRAAYVAFQGIVPADLSARMTAPERALIGHPVNPAHLLPVVEICGGEDTHVTLIPLNRW